MTKYLQGPLGLTLDVECKFDFSEFISRSSCEKLSWAHRQTIAMLERMPVAFPSNPLGDTVYCAEAKPDGSFELPHHKYCKTPPVNHDPIEHRPNERWAENEDGDLNVILSSNERWDALPCSTCDGAGEIVEFNLRKPCPDCAS